MRGSRWVSAILGVSLAAGLGGLVYHGQKAGIEAASHGPAAVAQQGKKNPYTGSEEAAEEGKQIYLRYGCYGCHGRGAGGGMGPSLIDTEWRYGGDDASVFKSIHDGRPGGMPAWGSRLSEEEIWKIIAFLRSQYKGDPKAVVW